MPAHPRFILAWTLFAVLAAPPSPAAADGPLENGHFRLRAGTTGLTGLRRTGDAFDTDYIAPGRSLGEVVVRYRKGGGKWQELVAGTSGERLAAAPDASAAGPAFRASYLDRYYMFHADFNDHYADLELVEEFRLEGEALHWVIGLRNLGDEPLEVGDIALPLPFNGEERWDPEVAQTRRVVRHGLVSGSGSFFFWMRPNSAGPFLVMTPVFEGRDPGLRPARLEYMDEQAVYIHSAASGEDVRALGGTWRQDHTRLILGPRESATARAAYAFEFRWADGYDGVRDVVYSEGLPDIHIAPGMTLPTDLAARIAFRVRGGPPVLSAEHPAETRLEYLGERGKDTHVFAADFRRLGENLLRVEFGKGRRMVLEFFVTEPLETLYKKRAAFLAARQLHRDPAKWYDGLFSDWDMKARVLRGPDDLGGLKDYWMASDDPALCKAAYLAEKNVHFPDPAEIEALEYHIRNFVWGKLQCTDRERYPYGVYGIPNWKVNRESRPDDRRGWTDHLWRLYDYPHVIMLYLDMARIARDAPRLVRYLDKDGYLERAYGTAKAYFTVPLATGGWDARELATFNEIVIADLIEELERNGRTAQARTIRGYWEEKVRHFINDRPNIFIAEYPFGPCGFESTEAFAKYALERAAGREPVRGVTEAAARTFLEEQTRANISLRGWLETAYYLLGSSDPGSLFYMSQMGGWSIVDYALHFARDPVPYLRLGYASMLSGWALLNSGPSGAGQGYWYPGPENDGAASGGFVMQAFGHRMGQAQPRGAWNYGGEADLGFGAALRTAATVVAEDPIFGLIAYGGDLTREANVLKVVPKDGLRQRLHVLRGKRRLHLVLERDGFAASSAVVLAEDLGEIRFWLENRTGDGHRTRMRISGAADGTYEVIQDGRAAGTVAVRAGREAVIGMSLDKGRGSDVTLRRLRG